MASILYVDDERSIGRAVHAWFSRRGVEVRRAHSLRGARLCLERYEFVGAFIDLWLGDGSGFDLYEEIRAHHPSLAPCVAFVTGDTVPKADVTRRLQELGCPVLTKPFDLSELETWVDVWRASAERASRVGEPRAGEPRDGSGDGPPPRHGASGDPVPPGP